MNSWGVTLGPRELSPGDIFAVALDPAALVRVLRGAGLRERRRAACPGTAIALPSSRPRRREWQS